MKMSSIGDFERSIFLNEGIQIVFRCPLNHQVKAYDFERKAKSNTKLSDFVKYRIIPYVGADVEFEIVSLGFIHRGIPNITVGEIRNIFDELINKRK